MEKLIEIHYKLLSNTSLDFVREAEERIDWRHQLIGITGARGVGKTTLLLQHILKQNQQDQSLYVSLDNVWFIGMTLIELADQFSKRGGKFLYLDEVHKYDNWSQSLKNIHDNYPELKVVFTGSSLLNILNSKADLSRRAVVYHMQGLSLREYINLETGEHLGKMSIGEIFEHHPEISRDMVSKIKPLKHFNTYLKNGYYPFYRNTGEIYHHQLTAVINMILELELPLLRGIDVAYSSKLKQLLSIIASSAPFTPNVSGLSEKIGINRHTLLAYLHYLEEAGLTKNLQRDGKGVSLLQKPDKIFLENTNLSYALRNDVPDIGNMRETFFANQVGYRHKISTPEAGDFLVDDKWKVEIGGRNKKLGKADPSKSDLWIASDDMEFGYLNRIPLWLFGFLY